MSVMKEWERQRAEERRRGESSTEQTNTVAESDSADTIASISYGSGCIVHTAGPAVAISQDDWLGVWIDPSSALKVFNVKVTVTGCVP